MNTHRASPFPPGRYPGAKNGSGMFQQIINQMPPHTDYIETHLGTGAVLRRKRLAPGRNIGIDRDSEVIAAFGDTVPEASLVCGDATAWLQGLRFKGLKGTELIYADPPYWPDSRKEYGRNLYRYEMDRYQHADLLEVLVEMPCMVIISGYYSDYYAQRLQGWRTHTFQAQTRRGPATEWLWMNYPEPYALHDYRFLGANYRERERIGRKITRWTAKLQGMDRLERLAIMAALSAADLATPGDVYRPASPELAALATTTCSQEL